jgi:hypothetical protein
MIPRSCYNYSINDPAELLQQYSNCCNYWRKRPLGAHRNKTEHFIILCAFAWRQVKVHMSQTEGRPGYSRVLTWIAMHDFSDDIKLRTNAIRRQLYYNIIMPLSQPCQSSRYGKFFAGSITVQVMHGLLPLFSG